MVGPDPSMLWEAVGAQAASAFEDIRAEPVARAMLPQALRARLAETFGDFDAAMPVEEVLQGVSALMRAATVQVTHPRYFGLFNPSVLPVAAAADALAAVWNPQLAAWSHAPAANEIERHALRFFLGRLGFDPDASRASFTTGGAEANLSAVLAALARAHPRWAEDGVAVLPRPPAIYVSAACHDSFSKVVRVTGLGRAALRTVPVDDKFRMDAAALAEQVRRDRRRGRAPLMVVGTAGTTAAGAVDPLPALQRVAEDVGAWFHVDAAYGGIGALAPSLAACLEGTERADSVTWDAHKGLSVPMGAGMFFCRHPEAVARAFSVRTRYRPGSTEDADDPYLTSMQWSRRFIGLKVFAALATHGAGGYAAMIEHQAAMGDRLRDLLREAGWRVVNDTPLPVVCFTHPRIAGSRAATREVERRVVASGDAWISTVRLGEDALAALRACITSYRTSEEDLAILLGALQRALTAA